MTPFARFFIVMLIIVPLAYFGASWYNGEDPLNVRQYLGLDGQPKTEQVTVVADDKSPDADLQLRIDEPRAHVLMIGVEHARTESTHADNFQR